MVYVLSQLLALVKMGAVQGREIDDGNVVEIACLKLCLSRVSHDDGDTVIQDFSFGCVLCTVSQALAIY